MTYEERLQHVSVLGAAGKMGSGILLLTAVEMADLSLKPENKGKPFVLNAIDVSDEALSGVMGYLRTQVQKIAEKKKHPQAKAIQVLCLLSLVFGGLLWPFAFLWAYSKPVMYKLAYGTDTVEPEHGKSDKPAEGQTDADQLKRLRAQVAELETRLAGKQPAEGEKA